MYYSTIYYTHFKAFTKNNSLKGEVKKPSLEVPEVSSFVLWVIMEITVLSHLLAFFPSACSLGLYSLVPSLLNLSVHSLPLSFSQVFLAFFLDFA